MRAALVSEYGEAPNLGVIRRPAQPGDELLVRVVAATINPIDVHIASGHWYGLKPALPYVPGRDGVGEVVEPRARAGELVYFRYSKRSGGALAEYAIVSSDEVAAVPPDLDVDFAAGIGLAGTAAFLAVTDRGGLVAGERVAVLGASGSVGTLAVQIAAACDAGRVVAVSRSAVVVDSDPHNVRRLDLSSLSSDETGAPSARSIANAIIDLAGGEVDLVIDSVWGRAADGAILALTKGGRLVNIGSDGGPEIRLSSPLLRGKSLSILGFTNATYVHRLAQTFGALADLTLAGSLFLPILTYPLSHVSEAWVRAKQPPRSKVVVRM